ncbi:MULTISPECIES: transcription initiation factor IIB family protein [Haloferax]|uniref:Transcription initiation factor IIB n=2 Tax=Haloferax TaxID=2251 RepID=A0A6G1YYW0_9EURY|nr:MULTISPECIES: transcription initiation factor IIB family protein [Haloferax]KAB1186617.1 transcription initiation factor IIB family protein [Haloferax sp. CBA1149]MRW79234.1 transcription initiation factor IIB family protein [Haloferax marinisediminis]
MSLREIYERTFDESCGKSIDATDCPECDGRLATDGGETSCEACGLIVDHYYIDHTHGPRVFDDDPVPTRRTGGRLTPTRHDRGVSAEIGYNRDANGQRVSSEKQRQLHRLRREHRRARFGSKAERNLATALQEIARMGSALDLPYSVVEEASQTYRRAQQQDLIRGRSLEMMAAGSLYATCRARGLPRRQAEIANVARCTVIQVRTGYRVLNSELGIDAQIVTARTAVPRLASDCGVSSAIQARAYELAELADDDGITNGRNPMGVAAACLYLATKQHGGKQTQAEFATTADVTVPTLRARYYELTERV